MNELRKKQTGEINEKLNKKLRKKSKEKTKENHMKQL